MNGIFRRTIIFIILLFLFILIGLVLGYVFFIFDLL